MQSYSDILFYSLMLKEPNFHDLKHLSLLPSDVGREYFRFSNPTLYLLKLLTSLLLFGLFLFGGVKIFYF